jgi:hypothetical protein
VVALPDPSSLGPTALYAGVSPVSAAGMMLRHSFLPRGRERVRRANRSNKEPQKASYPLYGATISEGQHLPRDRLDLSFSLLLIFLPTLALLIAVMFGPLPYTDSSGFSTPLILRRSRSIWPSEDRL